MQKELKIIKILATSDTHDLHKKINIQKFPQADIFIHAGDFTRLSRPKEFKKFRQFLQKIPCKHKIVIAGNHDFGLEVGNYHLKHKNVYHKNQKDIVNPEQQILKLKSVCTYLNHELIQIEGLKIFGSPFSPNYYDMGFAYTPLEAKEIWHGLPQNLDILITHTPPFNIRDQTINNIAVGCKQLREVIENVKPRYHIFGHIHQSFGYQKGENTNFYNVACASINYQVQNYPVLIQIPVIK